MGWNGMVDWIRLARGQAQNVVPDTLRRPTRPIRGSAICDSLESARVNQWPTFRRVMLPVSRNGRVLQSRSFTAFHQ